MTKKQVAQMVKSIYPRSEVRYSGITKTMYILGNVDMRVIDYRIDGNVNFKTQWSGAKTRLLFS